MAERPLSIKLLRLDECCLGMSSSLSSHAHYTMLAILGKV